jgi:hypothetical protein
LNGDKPISELIPSVRRQIDDLVLERDRPLVICDVDEVVVHFIRSLERHLEDNGCWLDAASYALNGNVRERHSNEPVSTKRLGDLLFGCFTEHTHKMDAIDGATDSLESLSAHAEIVMLTNLPENYLEDRITNLTGHGMPYPVVANSGEKGPAVDALLDGSQHVAVFIDDSPTNIRSVGNSCPSVDLVHFIPDPRFSRHIGPMDGVALRSDNWNETHEFILDRFLNRPPA